MSEVQGAQLIRPALEQPWTLVERTPQIWNELVSAPLRRLTISTASLSCKEALPSKVITSSRDAGWTAALLDRHQVAPTSQPFETKAVPEQTIVVMTRGEQDLEAFVARRWQHTRFQVGTVGMIPGGKSDRLRRRTDRTAAPFEKINLYVPQGFFHEAADHYGMAGRVSIDEPLSGPSFSDAAIAQTILSLMRGAEAGAPDFYAQAAMQWLAAHLQATRGNRFDLRADTRFAGLISDRRLERVVDCMTTHFADALSLDKLAAEAGVSKFHFTRLFRQATGMTPYAYLLEVRLDAGRRMLASTDLSVTEISARCGFARLSHFTTTFKRRFGTSPTASRLEPITNRVA